MWRSKNPPTEPVEIPDDINEARDLRLQAAMDLEQAKRQAPAIDRLTSYLRARREQNHFGDAIQITYTRRGHA